MMKKIFVLVCLTAIIILSGCIPFLWSQGFSNPVPNSEISESLISRMQNNIDTHTLEGFTGESTFGDVLGKIDARKISNTRLVYNSDLLGYPSVVYYSFSYYGGENLVLDHLYYDIICEKSGAEDLLTKLDAELGSHKKESDVYGDTDYIWEKNGCRVHMTIYEGDYEPGMDASITVYAPWVLNGRLPEIPDIFPYQFGTDIGTIYESETPGVLPEDSDSNWYLEYEDNGIELDLRFEADETGNVRLCNGRYFINLNYMGFEDSLDYFESIADGLEAAGTPDSRGYGISEVYEDETGITVSSEGMGDGGQGLSAEEILDSGKKYYWLDVNWPGINFRADYGMGVDMNLYFTEEYIDSTIRK